MPRTLYYDYEASTAYAAGLSVQGMPLLEYCRALKARPGNGIDCVAWAVDDEPVQVCRPGGPGWATFLATYRDTAHDPEWVHCCHNAGYDVRLSVYVLDLPWPLRVHCTKELAHAWTPNEPGGYSLDNLAKNWGLPFQKGKIDFHTCTQDELEAYAKQDVEVCRVLHVEALHRLPTCEVEVAELTFAIKELELHVDQGRIQSAVESLTEASQRSALLAAEILGDDSGFGDENGIVRSVKPHEIKRLLLENLGFQTNSISQKKINPLKLAGNAKASAAIKATGDANKALTQKRNYAKFWGVVRIVCELIYFAAHTGRESSRNEGRGVNLHNLPKRNPELAKPARQMFRLPPDLLGVSADFANVEYRIEGWLSNARHPAQVFAHDVLADPYAETWRATTGQAITKKDPERQVAKEEVLGLGFMMGLSRWIETLLRMLAESAAEAAIKSNRTGQPVEPKITEAHLEKIVRDNGWAIPTNKAARYAQSRTGCSDTLLTVAYHTRESFHLLHPEFGRLARWILGAVETASAARDPAQALAACYQHPHAPDPDRLELFYDPNLQGITVRVRAGRWEAPTVAWRDLGIRETPFGPGLTTCQGYNKGFRRFTLPIGIENCVQTCARNAMVAAKRQLQRRGWDYMLSVHDEIRIITPREPGALIKARQDLLEVCGPGNALGYDWAVVVNPKEICVSSCLYDDEDASDRLWQRLLSDPSSVDLSTVTL